MRCPDAAAGVAVEVLVEEDVILEVRIFGEPMRVRAEISSLDELSAHADQGELMEWIRPLAPSLRRVFLVHGEPQQSQTLAKLLHSTYNLEVAIPAPGQSFDLA